MIQSPSGPQAHVTGVIGFFTASFYYSLGSYYVEVQDISGSALQ